MRASRLATNVAYSEVGQISNGKSRLAFIDESAIDIAGGQTGSYVPCFMRRFPDRCIEALGQVAQFQDVLVGAVGIELLNTFLSGAFSRCYAVCV